MSLAFGEMQMTAIGIQLNNPMNIRRSNPDTAWRGAAPIQDHPSFVRFTNPIYGFRAGVRIIDNYGNKYGFVEIQDIIERYAPPHENNVDKYIRVIYSVTGLDNRTKIDFRARPDEGIRFIYAMTCMEVGHGHPYTMELIEDAIYLALRKRDE